MNRLTKDSPMYDTISYFADRVLCKPFAWLTGVLMGFVVPFGMVSSASLVALVIIDTFTGRSAAYARSEDVTSSVMRQKILTKLQGYLIFVITAGLASTVVGDLIILRGAMGLLSAVEFFSIAENLYDMGMIAVDPRKAPLFRSIVGMIKLRKRRTEQEDIQ